MDLTVLILVVRAYIIIHMLVTLIRAYLGYIRLSSIFTSESIGIIEFGREIFKSAIKPGTFILAIIITLLLLLLLYGDQLHGI